MERLDGGRMDVLSLIPLLLGAGKLWMTQLDSGLLNSGGAMLCVVLSQCSSLIPSLHGKEGM